MAETEATNGRKDYEALAAGLAAGGVESVINAAMLAVMAQFFENDGIRENMEILAAGLGLVGTIPLIIGCCVSQTREHIFNLLRNDEG